LKPENILLTVNYIPKIADFGYSSEMSENSPIVGTIKYFPPEMHASNKLNHPCDG